MEARVGDLLRIRSQHIDQPERRGEIREVHGAGGAPPYLVKWESDGHEALVYPGPDAVIVQSERAN